MLLKPHYECNVMYNFFLYKIFVVKHTMSLISNTIMTYLLVKSLKTPLHHIILNFFTFNLSGTYNGTDHPTNCKPSSEYDIHHSNHEFKAVNVR